jgi:hypothetical protein
MNSFMAFLRSPVGPTTTHFWGPVANWGFVVAVLGFVFVSYHLAFTFVLQGISDMYKPPEIISENMCA